MLYLAQVHLFEYYSGVQHATVGLLLDTWRPYTRPIYTAPVEAVSRTDSGDGDVDTGAGGKAGDAKDDDDASSVASDHSSDSEGKGEWAGLAMFAWDC